MKALTDFGVSVPFSLDIPDTYGVMESVRRELAQSQRMAMELDFCLSGLREAHPGRAQRWAKAQRAHEAWLATLEPKRWPTCEMCGHVLDEDEDDWDD